MDLIDEAIKLLDVVNDPKYIEAKQLVHLHPNVVNRVIDLLRRYKNGDKDAGVHGSARMGEKERETTVKVYGIEGIKTVEE